MKRTALFLLVTLVASPALAQDSGMGGSGEKNTSKKKIDNPAYAMWASHKPGTSVTMKTVSDYGGQKSEIETTTTLESVSDTKIVLEMKTTMSVAGQKIEQPASTLTHPAKIDEPEAGETAAQKVESKTETSKETIEIAGSELECDKTKTTTTFQGQKTVTTTWTCKKIPGHVVKSVTRMSGGTTSSTVTAFKIAK